MQGKVISLKKRERKKNLETVKTLEMKEIALEIDIIHCFGRYCTERKERLIKDGLQLEGNSKGVLKESHKTGGS